MRLTTVILIASLMQVSAAGLAQKITLTKSNAPLKTVLKEIRQQSVYIFLYNEELIKSAKPVNIKVNNADFEDVLNQVFSGQPLSYSINEKTIIIKEKEKSFLENIIARFQAIDVRGKVVDEQNQPLVGASVNLKGKNQGTKTDAQGNFYLANVDEKATLVISFVGYKTMEVVAKADLGILIIKLEDNSLEQVQVIAYGEVKKRFNTSNVGVISSEVIQRQPITNPLLALQGRVPGLYIQQSSGISGGAVSVLVQGRNSLTKGNVPFYVIDGVPYTPDAISNGTPLQGPTLGGSNTSNLNFINPADIESITVLKDADATAIYGSRAANGAILVTTKKGKAGLTKVDLNLQTGWGKVSSRPEMMNTQQYLALRKEAKQNANAPIRATDYDINGVWDTTRNVDWQEELISGTAQYQNLQASISGGSERTQFLAGTGYLRETTVFPGDFSNVKASVNFNINHSSSNQKFRFFLSGSYLEGVNKLPNGDLADVATRMAPNAPKLYNDDGTLNWQPNPNNPSQFTFRNPAALLLSTFKTNNNNLISNSQISYELIPGLLAKTSLGYNRLTTDELLTNPLASIKPDERVNNKRSAGYSDKRIDSWIIEPQLTFNKSFSFGTVDALLGSTFQQSKNSILTIFGNDYASDALLEDLNAASTKTITGSLRSTYKYSAIFGRLNYRYKERYIANFTARRDGSSRFGSENLFNSFYSVGGAWLFSEEEFFKKISSFMNMGKLRVTYGTTGNDQIGDYEFYSLYDSYGVSIPYQDAVGLVPRGLSNPYLQWEETRKLNLGADLGFFNSRLSFNINYFRNRSSNQLLGQTLSVVTGFGTITRNLPATVQNTGWEISVEANPVRRNGFNWLISANITIPKNKLIRYDGLEESADRNTYVIGKSTNIQKVYVYTGISSETGLYEFRDSKGALTSTPNSIEDATKIIDLNPKYYGGFANTFSYRGLSLDIFFDFVNRNGFSPKYIGYPGVNPNVNSLAVVENHWRNPGDDAEYQKVTTSFGVIRPSAVAMQTSDATYVNLTYARLKNVSLSYNLNRELIRKAHITNARLFIQGQNLLTFTNFFGGGDPEVVGFNTLGTLRIITVGMQLTF